MIDKLVHDLAVATGLTAEEILDVLWLAAAYPDRELTGATGRASASDGPSGPARGPRPGGAASGAGEHGEMPLRLGSELADPREQTSATEVGLGSPRPIRDPLAFPRSLLRLRQVQARGQGLEVDIDGTVEATAEARRLMPVFTRRMERALDVALVVDDSPAMRIWDDTFDEFSSLLAQSGAFRSVSRWKLAVELHGACLLDPSGAIEPPSRLIDPSGRRLVLVATDAASEWWYISPLWDTLAAWCAAMPTALIQVLPPHYWAATAIGDPYASGRSRRPASPNSQYARRLDWWAVDPGGPFLPVVPLSPSALTSWAEAAVNGTTWVPGITATPPDPEYAPSAASAAEPAALVSDFLSRASPGAERLARVLANASRLSTPLIAILQERLAPETGTGELAEILASHLLEEASPGITTRQPLLQFRPGIREILQRGTTTFEQWDAYDAVTCYLEERQSEAGSLRALVADPAGTSMMDAADEPFAAIQRNLAERLGIRAIPVTSEESRAEPVPGLRRDQPGPEPVRAEANLSTAPAMVATARADSARKWDAVIDVSNVCWSPALPPVGRRRPVWERLNLVMTAWRQLHGHEVRFHLVADESLLRIVSDATEPRRLKTSGDLVTVPAADTVILRLARDQDLHVISRDHFIDSRNAHPWIEHSPERFHGWEVVDGEVRITPLGVTPRNPQETSLAEELKYLKLTRLDPENPRHRRILQTRWKCANTSCPQSAQWQGQLLVWPQLTQSGLVMCPSCGDPLEDLGPRERIFEIVAAECESQTEIMRFPLEVDVPVIVGRGSMIKGVDLAMDTWPNPPSVSHVSRRHLLMRMEEVSAVNSRLAVIDLDSTNGTQLQRWAGTGFRPPRVVPTDTETFLSAKDRLILGGTILLRLSGRRFIMRSSAPVSAAPMTAEPSSEATISGPRIIELMPPGEPR